MTIKTEAVEYTAIETHVECAVWDPFPTLDKCRYDGCTREAIVAACVEKYRTNRFQDGTMLIAITIYEVSVVRIKGVTFKSEPLNKQTWSKAS
jgi:hypothetical protein